jgi:SAM-dependent methyltransferase
MSIKSPVTLTGGTSLVETIPVPLIVEGYKGLLGMDVGHYFEGLSEIGIYRCHDTGFRFYHPETIFGDAAFYAELQQKDFYYNQWIWEHGKALAQMAPGSKVLEVGCGIGSFIGRLAGEGFDCTGLELNSEAAAVCQQKGLKVYNELLEAHIERHRGQYDVVCAFQVLEHVYDVHSFINCCLQCLKPGGKLIVAVPNNNPWYYRHDKHHLMNLPPHHSGLWNKESFLQLPRYFPMTAKRIAFEPLLNRVQFIQTWLKHHRLNGLYRLSQRIPPGIVSRLLWPLKWWVQGKCVLAVFEKNGNQ